MYNRRTKRDLLSGGCAKAVRYFAIGFFLFLFTLNNCKTLASEPDSIAIFDELLSFRSDLSSEKQVVISRQAEKYATEKGNVYKAYSYISYRAYLYFSLDSSDQCIALTRSLVPKIEEEIERDKDAKWKILLVDSYSNIALSLLYREKSDSAMDIYQGLLARFEKDSIHDINGKCFNGIGAVFAYRQFYELAGDYFNRALRQYELSGNTRGIFIVCSNLGALYFTRSYWEEALPYCTRAYQIARKEKYKGQESVSASLAMGSIYTGLQQYQMADTYFVEAVRLSKLGTFHHLEGFVESAYANNLFHLGRYEQARTVAEQALKKIKNKKKYVLQVSLLEILSYTAEKQGDIRASLDYMREFTVIKDSLLAVENLRQLLAMEHQYDNYRREQEAKVRSNELELASAKTQNRTLWIIVLSVCLILLVILIAFLLKRVFKFHKITNLIKEESRKQIETVEHEIEGKNKELATNALQFLRLNNLQTAILEELKKLKTAFVLKGKEKMIVCEIENMAKQIASEKEWKDFQFYFEQVDKDFLRKLSERYPDLTANEKHLCVLFNLGLSNRDVANLTGRTLQSVGMAKFRLKSKLHLENSDELVNFLHSL